MPRYTVTVPLVGTQSVTVEADSEAAALSGASLFFSTVLPCSLTLNGLSIMIDNDPADDDQFEVTEWSI